MWIGCESARFAPNDPDCPKRPDGDSPCESPIADAVRMPSEGASGCDTECSREATIVAEPRSFTECAKSRVGEGARDSHIAEPSSPFDGRTVVWLNWKDKSSGTLTFNPSAKSGAIEGSKTSDRANEAEGVRRNDL
jgi:hypothetical protein